MGFVKAVLALVVYVGYVVALGVASALPARRGQREVDFLDDEP